LLSWVRAQDAPAVGAFGLSLGGCRSSKYFGQGPLFAKRQFWVSA
jgi:hypothetical protein